MEKGAHCQTETQSECKNFDLILENKIILNQGCVLLHNTTIKIGKVALLVVNSIIIGFTLAGGCM